MAILVSPGTSVTVTDESFYVPASAPTVPLLFVATKQSKLQPDGVSKAIGTEEHSVIRTVTSLNQSTQLYGIPRFLETANGLPQHGDARNEYGLLALNKFLGVGNSAYVVRANVNLDDDKDSIDELWLSLISTASQNLEASAQSFINEFNLANGYVATDVEFKVTVTQSELLTLIDEVMLDVYDSYNFSSVSFETDFAGDHTAAPYNVYDAGFTAITGTYLGVEGASLDWVTNLSGSTVGKETEFTPAEASTFLTDQADDFSMTVQYVNDTQLGTNDAARRTAIVTALQAATTIQDVRAEGFEFNLVLCPGFSEVVDDLVTLVVDIDNEAAVIGDIPMDKDPDEAVTWAQSTDRVFNTNVFYYYSHGLGTNLDGKDVLAPASAVALRTIAVSDNLSKVWFAPAGAQRGVVTGFAKMGYASGTLGQATEFVEAKLSKGQRGNLYADGTNVNPITWIDGRGLIVMGQKSSANATSALDRVNVVRLLAYIKRQLRKSSFPFIFEPNDQRTRDNLKSAVDGFLSDLITQRGLYDFATLCDSSNNTPTRIDRNELWLDIALKPTKSAEFIYIPIRVLSTGAEL